MHNTVHSVFQHESDLKISYDFSNLFLAYLSKGSSAHSISLRPMEQLTSSHLLLRAPQTTGLVK